MIFSINGLRAVAAKAPYSTGTEKNVGKRFFQVPLKILFSEQIPKDWEEATVSVQLRDSESRIHLRLHNPGNGVLRFGEVQLSAYQSHGTVHVSPITEEYELDIDFI
jgi:hypothetical protein